MDGEGLYAVVTDDGGRNEIRARGISGAVDAYYASVKFDDDAPLAVGAYLVGNQFVGVLR